MPQKKGRGGRKRGGRNFLNADLEWARALNADYGASTALAYAVLGTHANMQRQHKKRVCVVPCDVWEKEGFDETTWRRALKNLIEAGAIDYEKLDRSTLRIFVSDNPAEPAFGALESLDQGNLQNDG
jgi:hypothetical protein